jgi:ectoine hydroxylase
VVYSHVDASAPLSKEQIHRYDTQGFLVLENIFSPQEVRALQADSKHMLEHPDELDPYTIIFEPGSEAVRSIFSIHRQSEAMARFVADRRLADIAHFLLGDDVYIHQSRLNFKPGLRGREFYWHSDFETWHVEDGMPAMRALSCSVLLTDNTPFNGPLTLIPGSHRQFVACVGETPEENYKTSLRRQDVGVPDPLSLRLLAEQGGLQAVTAPAGSVVFFDCNTLHSSGGNLSPWARSNVFMVYNSVENQLVAPFHGMAPRPEHIAARKYIKALSALAVAA